MGNGSDVGTDHSGASISRQRGSSRHMRCRALARGHAAQVRVANLSVRDKCRWRRTLMTDESRSRLARSFCTDVVVRARGAV